MHPKRTRPFYFQTLSFPTLVLPQSSAFFSCTLDRLVSFLQEEFIKRCRRKVESIKESQLEVDGAFMSEEDMIKENYKPCLGLQMQKNEVYRPYMASHLNETG